jgi:RND family efflux transporter MFP subunit
MKFFLGLGMMIPAFLAGCRSGVPAAPAPETAAARVVASTRQTVPVALPATGTVHAQQSATISAQVMGRIVRVLVREGDRVRAGQTLVVLDGAALRSSVEQSRAGVQTAEQSEAAARSQSELAASTLVRYRQLQAQKSVSPQEMDEVSRRAEAAQAQLAAALAQTQAARAQASGARIMLGYTRLTAPFAGVVTARMADPGTLAAPGLPILQIDQAGTLQLQASVDESALSAVRKGATVAIAVGGQNVSGTVVEILPAADPASRSFLVRINLPSSLFIRAGMYGTASFSSGTRTAILAPRSAIVARGSIQCAYVLDARGIAQLRYLTLGTVHGNSVEVQSGLSAGEQLVDSPGDRDLAGKRIVAQESGVRP